MVVERRLIHSSSSTSSCKAARSTALPHRTAMSAEQVAVAMQQVQKLTQWVAELQQRVQANPASQPQQNQAVRTGKVSFFPCISLHLSLSVFLSVSLCVSLSLSVSGSLRLPLTSCPRIVRLLSVCCPVRAILRPSQCPFCFCVSACRVPSCDVHVNTCWSRARLLDLALCYTSARNMEFDDGITVEDVHVIFELEAFLPRNPAACLPRRVQDWPGDCAGWQPRCSTWASWKRPRQWRGVRTIGLCVVPEVVDRISEGPVVRSPQHQSPLEIKSDVLRGVRTDVVHRRRATLLSSAAGSEATYLLSRLTDHLGAFLSHSWCVSRSTKWLALCVHFNLWTALFCGAMTAVLLCGATSLGWLPLPAIECDYGEYEGLLQCVWLSRVSGDPLASCRGTKSSWTMLHPPG